MTETRKPASILIVDDEVVIAQGLRRLLQAQGYEVPAIATSGPEAIELASKHQPQLVLMDIRLPGPMDGIEAARRLRATCDPAIVYITGYADEAILGRATLTAPLSYLLKPVQPADLHTAIEVALYRHRMEQELRQRDQALQESQRRFARAEELAHIGSWEMDIATGKCTWSDEFFRICGYEPQVFEPDAEIVMSLIHPDDQERVAQALRRSIESGEPYRVEKRIVRPDGSIRHVVAHGEVIRDEANTPVRLVGSFLDVTERQHAQERLRMALRAADMGIWDWDIVENRLYWSEELMRLLGLEPGSFDGTYETFATMVHPADHFQLNEDLRRSLEDPTQPDSYRSEHRLVRPDGQAIWTQATGRVMRDAEGRPIRMIGTTIDITERKQAEKQLAEYSQRLEELVEERTQELREAQQRLLRREKLAVLGQLAGSVGHDLRQPLGVIANAVYYLKMVHGDADATIREYLDLIDAEVRNANSIIGDLLDFARTREPMRGEFDVATLVHQLMARRTVPDDITVTIDIPEDLPPAYADVRQITQVLNNLIDNACHAMPEGGRLTISAEVTRGQSSGISDQSSGIGRQSSIVSGQSSVVSGQSSGIRHRAGDELPVTDHCSLITDHWLLITVSDTGTGISPENMKHLFEPLFTTKPKGIGLGLTTSKNLVEANHGTIEVTSKLGQGSTFSVILPAATPGKTESS